MNWVKYGLITIIATSCSVSMTAQSGYVNGESSGANGAVSVAQLPVYVTPSWTRTGEMPSRMVPQQQGKVPNQFVLSFVIPAPEIVKERQENHSSNITFEGKSIRIDASYGGNMEKLIKVERTIDKVQSDRNRLVKNIVVTGYSSIEGYEVENARLAQERAMMLAKYFGQSYGYRVDYYWRGEDWTGLANLVINSNMADKYQVINIINTTEDTNLRKMKLRQLSGGETYKTMQRELFPLLNRTDYTIVFDVKNFDAIESEIALYSNPSLLSLNELYTLAASYSVGSREFLNVFEVASNLYPTDIASVINNAAMDIIDGANDRAINILQYISDPTAVNNLGVACARKGDMPRATYYFDKAAQMGNKDAEQNLALAQHWGF